MSLTPATFLAARSVSSGVMSNLMKRQQIDSATPDCVATLACDYTNNLSWTCAEGDESCVLFCDAFQSGDYLRESIKCVEAACSNKSDSDLYIGQLEGVIGEMSGLCPSVAARNIKREEEEASEVTTPAPTPTNEFIPSITSAICNEEPIPGEYDPKNPSLGAINPDCACLVTGTPNSLSNGSSPGLPDPAVQEDSAAIKISGVKGGLVAAVLFGSLFTGFLI